jgi:hypothetical protein
MLAASHLWTRSFFKLKIAVIYVKLLDKTGQARYDSTVFHTQVVSSLKYSFVNVSFRQILSCSYNKF